jgi:uncharacterized membrane protein
MFLKRWESMVIWMGGLAATSVVLYFTWYKHLPSADER